VSLSGVGSQKKDLDSNIPQSPGKSIAVRFFSEKRRRLTPPREKMRGTGSASAHGEDAFFPERLSHFYNIFFKK